jgi:hypothetical protein
LEIKGSSDGDDDSVDDLPPSPVRFWSESRSRRGGGSSLDVGDDVYVFVIGEKV